MRCGDIVTGGPCSTQHARGSRAGTFLIPKAQTRKGTHPHTSLTGSAWLPLAPSWGPHESETRARLDDQNRYVACHSDE